MKVRNVHSGRFGLPSGKVLARGEIGDAHDSFRASPLIGPVFEIVEEPAPVAEPVLGNDGAVVRFTKQHRSGRGSK